MFRQRLLSLLIAAPVVAGLALVTPGVAHANQTITGEGSATVPLKRITKSVIVEITINAEGPVQARPVLSNGGKVFPWVDSTGPWSGTVFQEKEFKPIVGARVSAAGPWTISVKPLATAPKVSRGTGSAVIQLNKIARGTVIKRFTYQGQGDFKVFPISAKGMSGFATIEESGPYSGRAFLPPGTKYIAVVASGNWQMK
jgi:hypothetical protein